jgi:hypothetical protein
VQVTAAFDTDPGWEAVNNRVVATGCPTIRQDFGWGRSGRAGTGGAIGGTVWRSPSGTGRPSFASPNPKEAAGTDELRRR